MGFICHTLSLAVKEACDAAPLLADILDKIKEISTFFNQHETLSAKLITIQCKEFGRDRIVTLDKNIRIRKHSKLNVLEKYTVLSPY